MSLLPQKRSLSSGVFTALIIGELAFAVVLGMTIGGFGVVSGAQQRQAAMRQISATIAAGLMPMVADQKQPQVDAQLTSILESLGVPDINGITLRDASGRTIASQGKPPADAQGAGPPRTPFAVLLDEQVVVQPVVIDGLTVAEVQVQFAPAGLSVLRTPIIATGVVLLAVMVISVPWTAWRLSLDLREPLAELGTYASRLAEGNLDAPVERPLRGEIGDLQDRLGQMAAQLRERDDALRGSYANLEDAYASLERAKHEIEQLSAVKSNFVAVAAHEIRSPLSTINLYAELLETGEAGTVDDTALDAVAAISSASGRLNSIVSDLMDSALLERGRISMHFEDIWLVTVLEEAVADAGVIGRSRGARVTLSESTPDCMIRADALRLRQVLDNLLSNAIKYSPRDTEVHVSASEEEGWLDIDVADRGRGIPPGSESKLFALFGRLDFGDSRDTAGLGLGLAISARIVEAHGGHISYRANSGGVGSVFTVRLPLTPLGDECTEYEAVAAEGGRAQP